MKSLVIGGAGFIGSNLVKRLLDDGHEVVVLDDLSRQGASCNLEWLREQGQIEFIKADIREYSAVRRVFSNHREVDVVYHQAAQVAVTTSVLDPRRDFEINTLGTLNVLEAIRELGLDPVFLFASTNKVYGGLEHLEVEERGGRYHYTDLPYGVAESEQLDFHSPYGCSKGAADQYVRDYARIYGLRSVVFRQSCIYGYRQFGVEDQGWVAWFTIASELRKPITIYGDGKQVRDVLFIDDLVDVYLSAVDAIDHCAGRIYNIGGGPNNQLSLLELLKLLEELTGRPSDPRFADWRPGDQPIFVADIRSVENDLGWRPAVDVREGVHRLHGWVQEQAAMVRSVLA